MTKKELKEKAKKAIEELESRPHYKNGGFWEVWATNVRVRMKERVVTANVAFREEGSCSKDYDLRYQFEELGLNKEDIC